MTFADGSSVPLGSGWRYAVAKRLAGAAPRVPWDDINGAGTLYNAMIAPLGATKLAGIAWYQGESDTGIPGYDRRLDRADRRLAPAASARPTAGVRHRPARQLRQPGDRPGRERLGRRPRCAATRRRRGSACRHRRRDSTSAMRSTSIPARSTRSASGSRG